MGVAIIAFLVGRSKYIETPPAGNIFVEFCSATWKGFRGKMKNRKNPEKKDHFLDYAIEAGCDEKMVKDSKFIYPIIVMFLPLPFFWALFDMQGMFITKSSLHLFYRLWTIATTLESHCSVWKPWPRSKLYLPDMQTFFYLVNWLLRNSFDRTNTGSRWIITATQMNGWQGGDSFKMRPDQIQILNPIMILLFLPLFSKVVYPLFEKCGIQMTALRRMSAGQAIGC